LEALTGTYVDPLVSTTTSSSHSRNGGFNNDWSITYAYVMGALGSLSDSELHSLEASASRVEDAKPAERLKRVKELRESSTLKTKRIKIKSSKSRKRSGRHPDAIDSLLLPRVESASRDCSIPWSVGESIVSTLFEEVFAGAGLSRRPSALPIQFETRRSGFVEKERVVLSTATVEKLDALLGTRRLGVASGSMMNCARHALRGSIDAIPREAQVWHEDVESISGSLHKPNGYPLIRPPQTTLHTGE